MDTMILSRGRGGEGAEREIVQSPPCGVKVENEWSYISNPMFLHGVNREFTVTFTFTFVYLSTLLTQTYGCLMYCSDKILANFLYTLFYVQSWALCKERFEYASKCTYDVTLRRVRANVVVVEKQWLLHILSVCVCSPRYPACNVHAP
jgi:hypothetical protein